MKTYEYIVIGAGVMGVSVAFHLARLGAKSVLVLEQGTIGSGTTSQSSGILRTHYSVRENIELARASWEAFDHFSDYLDDDEANCGLIKCGYMICAPEGRRSEALLSSLDAQRRLGINVQSISVEDAKELLPIAEFQDAAVIGLEADAGFADPYLVTTSLARAARRLGAHIFERTTANELITNGRRVVGVSSTAGDFGAARVISVQNVWSSRALADWVGRPLPVRAERHAVLSLKGNTSYSNRMPVFKDLCSPGLLYYRSYGGREMLVSEGTPGQFIDQINTEQAEVSLDLISDLATQISARFPAFEDASLASSWTGIYDVTPDWNPILGDIGGIEGLSVGFGFSGHGFKLAPAVGRLLAQHALGVPTDFSLKPYSIDRFERGELLVGRYGKGAVS